MEKDFFKRTETNIFYATLQSKDEKLKIHGSEIYAVKRPKA
jgi:hypothetical protein